MMIVKTEDICVVNGDANIRPSKINNPLIVPALSQSHQQFFEISKII